MTRLLKVLGLGAITLGCAFLTTAAQASAANFNVSFAVRNADSSASMIRQTDPLPSGITNLIAPPSAISPGNNDPASGFATYSLALPAFGHSVQTSLVYANVSNSSDYCTFTIRVANVGGSLPYVLHFASDQTRCTVPNDTSTSDGQFTGSTSFLVWKS